MMANFLVRVLARVLKPVILVALEPSTVELADAEARRAQRKAIRLEQDRNLDAVLAASLTGAGRRSSQSRPSASQADRARPDTAGFPG